MEDKKAESTEVAKHQPIRPEQMVIGVGQDMSNMTEEEREDLFVRYSQARAGAVIDGSLLDKELTAVEMTVFRRSVQDQETGELLTATYVSFTLADGSTFKSASYHAVTFAFDVATFVGYNPETGKLPRPIKFVIHPQKADEGFRYNWVFKGTVKEHVKK